MAIPQPTFRGSREASRAEGNAVFQQGASQLMQAIQHNREFEEKQHQFNVLQEGQLFGDILENTYQGNIGHMTRDPAGREIAGSFFGHLMRDSEAGQNLANQLVNAPRTREQLQHELYNGWLKQDFNAVEEALDRAREQAPQEQVSQRDTLPEPEPEPAAREERQRGDSARLTIDRGTGEPVPDRARNNLATDIRRYIMGDMDRNIIGQVVDRGDVAGEVGEEGVARYWAEKYRDEVLSQRDDAEARELLQRVGIDGLTEMVHEIDYAGTAPGDYMMPGAPEDFPEAQRPALNAATETMRTLPENANATQAAQHFDREVLNRPTDLPLSYMPSAELGTLDEESYRTHVRNLAEKAGRSSPDSVADYGWSTLERMAEEAGFADVEQMMYVRENLIKNSIDPNRPADTLEDIVYQPLTAIHTYNEIPAQDRERIERAAENSTGERQVAMQALLHTVSPEDEARVRALAEGRTDVPSSEYQGGLSPREARVVEREARRITRAWTSTGAAERRARDPEHRAAVAESTDMLLRAYAHMEDVSAEEGMDWLHVAGLPEGMIDERKFREGVRQFELEHNLAERQLALREHELEFRLAQLSATAEVAGYEMPDHVKDDIAFLRGVRETILDSYIAESDDVEEAIQAARNDPYFQELMVLENSKNQQYGIPTALSEVIVPGSDLARWWAERRGRDPSELDSVHLREDPLSHPLPPQGSPRGTEGGTETNRARSISESIE